MFGRATITLGIGSHSSFIGCFFMANGLIVIQIAGCDSRVPPLCTEICIAKYPLFGRLSSAVISVSSSVLTPCCIYRYISHTYILSVS